MKKFIFTVLDLISLVSSVYKFLNTDSKNKRILCSLLKDTHTQKFFEFVDANQNSIDIINDFIDAINTVSNAK